MSIYARKENDRSRCENALFLHPSFTSTSCSYDRVCVCHIVTYILHTPLLCRVCMWHMIFFKEHMSHTNCTIVMLGICVYLVCFTYNFSKGVHALRPVDSYVYFQFFLILVMVILKLYLENKG